MIKKLNGFLTKTFEDCNVFLFTAVFIVPISIFGITAMLKIIDTLKLSENSIYPYLISACFGALTGLCVELLSWKFQNAINNKIKNK